VSTLEDIYIHLKTHLKKGFQCDKCKYSTKYKANLKKHTATHEKIKYVCELCKYGTNNLNVMKHHERTHKKMVHEIHGDICECKKRTQ
jgi:NAD+--asparagine ADP-ribosyltransferase